MAAEQHGLVIFTTQHTDMFSYLQKAWSGTLHNITVEDIKTAIQETIAMDEEHGAFWVGVGGDEETVLETRQSPEVFAIFPNGEEYNKAFNNWKEIEPLYEAFLDRKFDAVKTMMKER